MGYAEQEAMKPKVPTPKSSPARSSGPMIEAQGPTTEVVCHCKKVAMRWEVKKQGPTLGRHFYRCKERLCEFFSWDEKEQAEIRSQVNQEMEVEEMDALNKEILKLQEQADHHVMEQVETMRTRMEQHMQDQNRIHDAEVRELKVQVAWLQSFVAQSQASSSEGFQMVQGP